MFIQNKDKSQIGTFGLLSNFFYLIGTIFLFGSFFQEVSASGRVTTDSSVQEVYKSYESISNNLIKLSTDN